MDFEFATTTRIVFGTGVRWQAGKATASMGRKAFVAAARGPGWVQSLLDDLVAAGVATTLFQVDGEPTVSLVDEACRQAQKAGCDVVVGAGGGSVLDTAKAVAAMLTNPGELLDYLEVVGQGQNLSRPSAPCIAIPTTAGTGSEVTRNAVLGVPEQQVKVSLRSPLMLPRLALVDPELTYGLPPEVTASTGLDALTQLIEPFTSNRANPLTDAICREGMRRAARSLPRVYRHGDDAEAREEMSLASLFGGLALANAKLGAVHGFAGVLGGMFPAPHGAVCARLLPLVMETNLRALQERAPESDSLIRYAEAARQLTGDDDATAADGARWAAGLVADLQIPPLSAYGVTPAHIPELVEKSARSSSMQGNPIKLTEAEMEDILRRAL